MADGEKSLVQVHYRSKRGLDSAGTRVPFFAYKDLNASERKTFFVNPQPVH